MIYHGPGLAREIVAGLPGLLAARQAATIAEAVGRDRAGSQARA
jgi:dihydroorotate dehydrogenase